MNPIQQIIDELGCSYDEAWFVHHVRKLANEIKEDDPMLQGLMKVLKDE